MHGRFVRGVPLYQRRPFHTSLPGSHISRKILPFCMAFGFQMRAAACSPGRLTGRKMSSPCLILSRPLHALFGSPLHILCSSLTSTCLLWVEVGGKSVALLGTGPPYSGPQVSRGTSHAPLPHFACTARTRRLQALPPWKLNPLQDLHPSMPTSSHLP